MIHGIDVSSYQGTPDWPAVYAAGFKFVIAKCTEGTGHKDKSFRSYVDSARKAGLMVGAYHFARVGPGTSASQQAKFLFQSSGGLGAHHGELPPALDIEARPTGVPSAAVIDWMREFLDACDELFSRRAFVYTYPNFWAELRDAGKNAGWLKEYPLWMAHYLKGTPYMPEATQRPIVPKPWDKWLFWQYSGDHGLPVEGVKTPCDRNLFNGTMGDLYSLAQEAGYDDDSTIVLPPDTITAKPPEGT